MLRVKSAAAPRDQRILRQEARTGISAIAAGKFRWRPSRSLIRPWRGPFQDDQGCVQARPRKMGTSVWVDDSE